MKKIKSKLNNVEKVLSMAFREVPDNHDIESAQKRVWNNLDFLINKEEPSLKPENINQKGKPSLLNFSKYAMSFGLIMLLIVAISGTSMFYLTKPQETPPSIDANNEITSIKSLAASRFKELNGISIDEYKEAVIPENNVVSNPTNPSEPHKTVTKLDSDKAEEILKKAQSQNQKIYYSKQNISFHNIEEASNISFFNLGTGKNPNIDYSKEILFENWLSLGYSKTVISQENKIIASFIMRPDSYLSYIGGKYAIQQNYKYENIVLAGLSTDGETIQNPEIELLKKILVENSLENEEIIKKDSEELFKIKVRNFSGILGNENKSNYKTYFYLKKETLSPVKYEQYIRDKLVATIQFTEIKQIEDSENSYFSPKELKNIEIKNVDIAKDSVVSSSPEIKLSDFIKKYPILTFAENDNYDLIAYDFQDESNISELMKLSHSEEYNPLYKVPDATKMRIATYSSQKSNLLYEIYSKKPEINKDKNFEIIITEKKIRVNEETVIGEYFVKKSLVTTPTNSPDSIEILIAPILSETNGIILEYKEKWFLITSFDFTEGINKIFESEITLSELSENDAKTIDEKNEEIKRAKPSVEYIDLNNISKEMRYLPGDLKEYGLIATFSGKSNKFSSEKTCEKYYLVDSDNISWCLAEKYDGFIINYKAKMELPETKNDVQISPGYNPDSPFLTSVVLNKDSKSIKELLKDRKFDFQIMSSEKDNYTIVILSNLQKEDVEKIISKISLDRDLKDVKKQIKEKKDKSNKASEVNLYTQMLTIEKFSFSF